MKTKFVLSIYMCFLVIAPALLLSCEGGMWARRQAIVKGQAPAPKVKEPKAPRSARPTARQAIRQPDFNYEVTFTPIVEFNGMAFPVNILSRAAMNAWPDGSLRMITTDDYIGDSLGDFGVSLTLKGSPPFAANVRLEVEGDRFIRKSSLNASVMPEKETELFPRITYDYQALERLIQPVNENVYFRLFYGTSLLAEKVEVVRFHSINEVPFRVADRRNSENTLDYTDLFAAYVNEDDPLIDRILQEALQIGIADRIGLGSNFSFSGYQLKDEHGNSGLSVDLQVLSIWSVFLKNNIKYSNIAVTSTSSDKIITQYVRTPGESFGNSQANCVDGCVLFASVLRKIGIESYLVLVPGHMFIGYLKNERFKDFNDIGFLETTMMGDVDLSKYPESNSLLDIWRSFIGSRDTQSTAILESFIAAQQSGQAQFAASSNKIFSDTEDLYKFIDISSCRSLGIMPVTRY